MTTTIGRYLSDDHGRCDELFVALEQLTAEGELSAAGKAFEAFRSALEHHFAQEEEVLFPTFEQASGSTHGPTQVMRYEHQQIRTLLATMGDALARGDAEETLGVADTLLILMQQHNAKEEQILYPMSDRLLPAATVVDRMTRLVAA